MANNISNLTIGVKSSSSFPTDTAGQAEVKGEEVVLSGTPAYKQISAEQALDAMAMVGGYNMVLVGKPQTTGAQFMDAAVAYFGFKPSDHLSLDAITATNMFIENNTDDVTMGVLVEMEEESW